MTIHPRRSVGLKDIYSFIRQFAKIVRQRFADDRCLRVAGALSYTTLVALVPLTAVTFAVLSLLPGFESWMALVQQFIYSNFVPASGDTVRKYLQHFAANAGKLTFWGMLFLALASLMVMATIERTFNDIWHVPQTRRRLHRYASYVALLTLSPVLIGISLSITSYLLDTPLFGKAAVPDPLRDFLMGALPVFFELLAFLLLYAVVPNFRVRFSHALVGSLFALILFEIAKRGFRAFVLGFSSYKVIYGAVAVLPVFLSWIYLSWTVILLGAVVTAAMPEWPGYRAGRQATRKRK